MGIETGKEEKNAWSARNRNAHGARGEDTEQEIQSTNVMFILFARVLLKLLGYKGKYIDYATLGYEKRKTEIED